MAKSSNQKLKLFYVQKMLREQTDDEHTLTVGAIIDGLEEHGIKAERKSVYDDIDTLKQFGEDDIQITRRQSNEYSIGERDFELPELKLLIDAVVASKFITVAKSDKIINKLEKLTSKYQAKKLQRQVQVQNRIKSMHQTIYLTVDKLHSAISDKKKISFQYWDWSVDKKEVFRKNGERYIESPCALCWDNEYYYLVTYNVKHQGFVHYRVDKMAGVDVLDDACDFTGMQENFDITKHVNRYFGMHSGREENVTLRLDNSLIGAVIDRFGKDVIVSKVDSKSFEITVKVIVSPVFIAWLMGFGEYVQVMSPANVRQEIKETANKVAALY